ncbi:response regulator [Synechocystis sp. PCC 7339]|uniref:response regulator n=1 Tax=unclassified Synechocystis TaxID=2640012 RepID=UPI001BAF1343|nr:MULTISPECIES: response regulator [unclassified Synechocystis]QUS60530.1 response regulator [Synechocystis sp. PCC 7338]UAJ72018.1 response regulator [Synechocystis sp. PCC 7339]
MTALTLPFFEDRAMANQLPLPRLPKSQDNEIKRAIPRELLEQLMAEQFTGQLVIRNPFDEFVDWQIYLGNGKIHFANSAVGNGKRLNYMLGKLFQQGHLQLPTQLDSDYNYICELWKRKYFSFQQTRSVLTQFTQEALVQALSLPKTEYRLDPNNKLRHLFLNLNLEQAVSPIEKKVSYWWELRSEINSPFQRPLVQDVRKLQGILTRSNFETTEEFWKIFQQSLEDLHCLYDIASATKLSTLQLAIAMRNLIKTGDITMLPYQEIAIDNRPLVVSVDENQTHQRIVEYTLEKSGYRVNTITDPFKALASLQGQNPHLILINADMEKMDGYQLASLCRKSPQLKGVPIMLMVENDNLVHNIKAKMSGVNDNLQKPFLPQDLLLKVKTNLRAVAIA